MNFFENYQFADETFNDIYSGEVIDREDPKNQGRLKIRVWGIFDEPILKDHIPWAYPISHYPKLLGLGDIVFVKFMDGDLYFPVYFP